MAVMGLVAAIGIGYLLGAIPSGVIVGRLIGVDPRGGGSGRTGTTNALRTLGTAAAVIVLVLDMAKGAGAVLIGHAIGASFDDPHAWAGSMAGVAAVIGHVRSIFIGFTGGRGAAPGAGAVLAIAPLALLAATPVFWLIAPLTGLVSLGTLLANLTMVLAAAALYLTGHLGVEGMVAAALIGLVIFVAHADNIGRLRAGTERRFGRG